MRIPFAIALATATVATSCSSDSPQQDLSIPHIDEARRLATESIMVDGHVDVPYRMTERTEDISGPTGGHFDYPRAVAGGLDAPFMSIYLPAARQTTPGLSKALADSLIDIVEGFVEKSPDKFALAYSPQQVRDNFAKRLISLPMGMENGSGIEDDLSNVQHFFDRGIRYVTLTHSKVNRISDSSYDTTRTWNGLSDFGVDVVREMNRLGIMVDVSHVSDSAFYDVVRVTQAPAIASHSSARHFTPGWERNMSDDMIRALADNGGVMLISFGCVFLTAESQQANERIDDYQDENGLSDDDPAFVEFKEANTVHASVHDVVRHINHVVDLVGVDHVGFGSDFDGVTWIPRGLEDVSKFPNIIGLLIEEGYTEEDIAKIMGGNALRVWEEVEAVAARMAG